ncbi:MAG TPA: alpha/beta hydrolase [Candidatus Binatia bacterium]|nr:alpha/beta hydrolase [Candidatus Binatia bacterium]
MRRRRFTAARRGGSGSPLVCIHGFMDTWRTWQLVLPALERHHDVLAPTVAGHAGGPSLADVGGPAGLVDALEEAMDDAGFESARVVGNSLGGYLALHLAARGRARSVVALSPAGGWRGSSFDHMLEAQRELHDELQSLAPAAEAIAATPWGRRRATRMICERSSHLPASLVSHLIRGAAACDAIPLLDYVAREGWTIDAERITCPVRIAWGGEDKVLPWPSAAERFRNEWLPNADYVELDGVGHCPQLDAPLVTADVILGFTA